MVMGINEDELIGAADEVNEMDLKFCKRESTKSRKRNSQDRQRYKKNPTMLISQDSE